MSRHVPQSYIDGLVAKGATLGPVVNISALMGESVGVEAKAVAAAAGEMDEKEFTALVIETARLHGWMTAHFRPAWTREGKMVTAVQGDGKGWPDLILVRERLIVAELKVGRNKPSPAQETWLSRLRSAEVPTFVWYPSDWDEIVGVLSTARPRGSPRRSRGSAKASP